MLDIHNGPKMRRNEIWAKYRINLLTISAIRTFFIVDLYLQSERIIVILLTPYWIWNNY